MIWSVTKAMVKVTGSIEPKMDAPQPPGTLWAFRFVQDDGSLVLKPFRFV